MSWVSNDIAAAYVMSSLIRGCLFGQPHLYLSYISVRRFLSAIMTGSVGCWGLTPEVQKTPPQFRAPTSHKLGPATTTFILKKSQFLENFIFLKEIKNSNMNLLPLKLNLECFPVVLNQQKTSVSSSCLFNISFLTCHYFLQYN